MDPIEKFDKMIARCLREDLDLRISGRLLRIKELKYQALMERLDRVWPIEKLALIYRALRGDIDTEVRMTVTIEQVELYHYEAYMTFYEFIRSNWLPVYEEVLR